MSSPLTAVPEELLAASAQLGAITTSLATQNAGAAGATTVIAPAASDPVSIQQAGIFSTYGTQYQAIAAEAQTIQEQYVQTLGTSSGTYSGTEAANASQVTANATSNAAGSGNIIDIISQILGGPSPSLNGNPFSLSSNVANLFNIGGGNWASAGSDLIGLAGGGLLDTTVGDAAAGADLAGTTAPAGGMAGMGGMGGMGAMPVAAGVGQATMVGKLSVPPSWAGTVAPATSSAAAVETVGWTGAAPQAGTIIPGMPGMGGARNSAGFGAPRYGVKPIVMPKPTAV